MALSEDTAVIVPRTKDEGSIQPGHNKFQQNQVDLGEKMQDLDHLEVPLFAPAGIPQYVPVDLPDHRRMTRPASPSTSSDVIGANLFPDFEFSLGSSEVVTTGKPMVIAEVLELLGAHGCTDLTDQLDTSNFSEHAIASGGYGDVYRGAFHNGTVVAVKCLRLHEVSSEGTKQLKRAARELYVWSKCNHPNVLGLIGVAQYQGRIAMVSPWMERGSLRQLLLQQAEVDRYTMCAQITDGVAYMHGENAVHGDLKCDNILVSSDFTPKLTDFGNASLKDYTLQFTETTSSAGISLNWVAPEMLTGQNHATMASDVYSLGMTMLEVLTGEMPYNGMSPHMIMFAKAMTRTLPVRPEAHISSHIQHANLLWSLFESCWAFNPEDRPSASEVKERMGQVVAARGSGNSSG